MSELPDPLTDLFRLGELSPAGFIAVNLRGPCAHLWDDVGRVLFWAVTEGSLSLEFDDGARFTLMPGDRLLATRRVAPLVTRSAAGAPLRSYVELFQDPEWTPWSPGDHRTRARELNHHGAGPVTRWVGALFDSNGRVGAAMLDNLPPYIHLKADRPDQAPWVNGAIREIVEQRHARSFGFSAMSTRIAELILITTIREYLESGVDDAPHWLGQVADPRIARVISAMHASPEAPWTVELMAAEANMSRSSFASRFTQIVGESPADHLVGWRMRLAAARLLAGAQSIKQVAFEFGYGTAAGFSVAFKRKLGLSPVEYRRAHGASAFGARDICAPPLGLARGRSMPSSGRLHS